MGMNASSTAFRTQKGSWLEVLCWLTMLLLSLLRLRVAGSLLFPFSSPVPAVNCLSVSMKLGQLHTNVPDHSSSPGQTRQASTCLESAWQEAG